MTTAPSIKSTARRATTATTHRPRVSLTGQRGTYLVESGTTPGLFYTTTACSCDCPARKLCKHSTFVRRLNAAFYYKPTSSPATRPAGFAPLDEVFGVAS